jgi:hypothetical protein
MVRRGANVTRAAQVAPSTRPAALPRISGKHSPPVPEFPIPSPTPLIESSCLHLECKLPINLRNFLAEHLGEKATANDESILDLAAHADEATLSKLARAIRRYSTARAHEAWAECSVPLAKFGEGGTFELSALCLRCASVAFGKDAAAAHQGPGCVAISFGGPDSAKPDGSAAAKGLKISDRIQRSIEEFRALRVAFGLPHFELDCYMRGSQMTFTWRPLP